MAIPTLESLTAALDSATVTLLGDPLTYTPDGGAPRAVNGFVDHSEGVKDFGLSAATVQDMTVSIRVADLGARPADGDRIALSKVAGKLFKPIGVRLDEGGTFWTFRLKEVK